MTLDSLKGVMQTTTNFATMSGLHINASKSSLYAPGPGTSVVCDEAVMLGIAVCSLPIHYLGLPLTTKALSKHDYELLIDKIQTHMLSWTNKTLSFALILPMGCLDVIESFM